MTVKNKKERVMLETLNSKPISSSNIIVRQMELRLSGTSPLLINNHGNWLLEKKNKSEKEIPPNEQYLKSLYYFADKKTTGIQAVAIKSAMVRAGKEKGYTMNDVRGKFHILCEDELVKINGKHSMYKAELNSGNILYFAEYKDWSIDMIVSYCPDFISEVQLTQLLEQAGLSIGIGHWRDINENPFGRFVIN